MDSHKAVTEDSESSGASLRRWLLLLLLAALLAGGGAWLYTRIASSLALQRDTQQQLVRGLNALEAQADRLEAHQADLAASTQRSSSQVSSFAQRLDAQDQSLGQLKEQLSGGRGRFQLASVEQLLLLASDRLQLAGDVPAALVALDEADARLANLREPRLYAVRQALAQEKAQLQAVPLPDFTGAALTLSSLIERVPHLPLATHAPSRFDAHPQRVLVADDAPWYGRLWASVRQALGDIFTVRRDNGPAPQLLTQEQEALIVQVLALKLEGARVALLRRDTVSFRDLAESAGAWLDAYFRDDDPGVAAAKAELQRLQPLDLNPPLPDTSRSLGLLRQFLAAAP